MIPVSKIFVLKDQRSLIFNHVISASDVFDIEFPFKLMAKREIYEVDNSQYTEEYLENIGKDKSIAIDRKIGEHHPHFEILIYTVNYGYVENTIAMDGKPIDAYILNVDKPLESFQGICAGVVERVNDNESKLIIIPRGKSITLEEVRKSIDFQEQYFDYKIHLGKNK